MKKLFIIVFTVFLNVAFYSCTPTSLDDESDKVEMGTGGEDGEILPEDPEDDGDND
ncbi:hypothetical protein JAO71_08500 [Olleya sp. YSTF-M6]|uniref:Uncharacterized protein n=1 Tax=Olleya sediminilitoris TaxID=2795739 RepID=A0ABS1WL41_9FLAO|nr:hypothetical protein [Olleya sediminilitoris]MBL7559841.1 hypothetical protein [Olleya sediminilitoris]